MCKKYEGFYDQYVTEKENQKQIVSC